MNPFKRACLLFFTLTCISLQAVDFIREGNAFFAIGEYEDARYSYKKALKRTSKPWKRAFIEYNMGTTYLMEKNWSEALDIFHQALDDPSLPNVLMPKLRVNMAIALIGEAETLLEKSASLSISPSRLASPTTLIETASSLLQQAEQEFCDLYQQEGYEECPEAYYITVIKELIQSKKAQIKVLEKSYRLSSIPFKAGAQILQTHLSSAIQQLELWRKLTHGGNNYLEVASAFKSADPLWKSLKARVYELPPQYRDLFLKTRKGFRASLILISEEKVGEGIAGLKEALQNLEKVIDLLPDPHPVRRQLEEGFNLFTKELIFEKINRESVERLKEVVSALMESSREIKLIAKEIEESYFYLQTASELLLNQHNKEARLYVVAASQSIERALINFDTLPVRNTREYLIRTLEFQQDAIDLSVEIQGASINPIKMQPLLISAQKNAIESARQFADVVLINQEEEYKGSTSEGTCQRSPWSFVMPLFHQGVRKANDALHLIETNPSAPLGFLISTQVKAYKLWTATLESLEEEQKSQEEDEEEEEEEIHQQREIDRVLQVLIEMDQQDRVPASLNEKIQGGTEKPW